MINIIPDKDQFYCQGIKNIKSYLKNKNNDKNIDDEDGNIVIFEKLKIFGIIRWEFIPKNRINKFTIIKNSYFSSGSNFLPIDVIIWIASSISIYMKKK